MARKWRERKIVYYMRWRFTVRGGDTRTARTMEVCPVEEHGQPLPAPEEPEVEGPMPCGRDEESVGTADRAGELS